MSRQDPLFKLRIPEALKAKIFAATRETGGSMTAEINSRVAASFDFGDRLTEMDAKLDRILSALEKDEK